MVYSAKPRRKPVRVAYRHPFWSAEFLTHSGDVQARLLMRGHLDFMRTLDELKIPYGK